MDTVFADDFSGLADARGCELKPLAKAGIFSCGSQAEFRGCPVHMQVYAMTIVQCVISYIWLAIDTAPL